MIKKHNKSTYFLLPLLGVPFYEFNQAQDCFVDSYCTLFLKAGQHARLNIPIDQKECLFVLLERKRLDIDVLYYAMNTSILMSRLVSEHHILLAYKILKFNVEQELFVVGKYSKFGKEAKNIIQDYVEDTVVNLRTGIEEKNENYYALFPTEESRTSLGLLLGVSLPNDAEIISLPNMEDETIELKFNSFKTF